MTHAYWPHCIPVGATDMDSIGLLLMALLSMNSGPSNAADDTVAASARSTRTQCVIAARADVNRAKQDLQACTSVPTHQSKLARIAATPSAAQQATHPPPRLKDGNPPR
jgi:hypothetical protein